MPQREWSTRAKVGFLAAIGDYDEIARVYGDEQVDLLSRECCLVDYRIDYLYPRPRPQAALAMRLIHTPKSVRALLSLLEVRYPGQTLSAQSMVREAAGRALLEMAKLRPTAHFSDLVKSELCHTLKRLGKTSIYEEWERLPEWYGRQPWKR